MSSRTSHLDMKRKRFAIGLCAVMAVWLALPRAWSASDAPPGEQICVSLRVLAAQADAAGHRMRKEVTALAGLSWLDGYVVDAANADIILVGRRVSGRPNLYLDDLAVSLRNVFSGDVPPYCSLDPLPANVLKQNQVMAAISHQGTRDTRQAVRLLENAAGPQTTVVGGVPAESRCAHVMIDADYHMKKVSQGLVEMPEVPSMLDRSIAEAEALMSRGLQPFTSSEGSQSRFWFHIQEGRDVTFTVSTDVVTIDECPVGVLTEQQRNTADGQLYDSGENDPDAQAFARDMSEQFPQMAHRVPAYADLENQYRLRALCCALLYRNDAERAGVDMSYFLRKHRPLMDAPMPPSLPGLANAREWSRKVVNGNRTTQYFLTPLVCGGVSMEMVVQDPQLKPDSGDRLERVRVASLSSRESPDALWWTLAPGRKEERRPSLRPERKSEERPPVAEAEPERAPKRAAAAPKRASRVPEFVRRGLVRQSTKP